MTSLTREYFKTASNRRYRTVVLPDGTSARLQSLTETERSEYEAIAYDAKGQFEPARLKLRRRKLLQLCLIDDAGERLFGATELALLANVDSQITSRLFGAAVEHSGILDEAEDIDEAKKNSAETNGSDSSTDSASSSE